jgi:glycosyltransferase involved in cell wall biosynthesis
MKSVSKKLSDNKLLVIIAADFDTAVKKGVESIFSQYDENGFFSKVILMSPYIRKDCIIKISKSIEMREFGWGNIGRVSRMFAPIHLLRFLWVAYKLIRHNNIGLIRATEPSLCGFLAWTVSRLSNTPYCISLHADYDQRYRLDGARGAPTIIGSRNLIYPLECFTLRNAICVLPIRKSLISYAEKRGVNLNAIRVIPHGINLEKYQNRSDIDIRKRFGLSANTKILAFVGRLSHENYLDDLLQVVRKLNETRKDLILVLAGGGPLENSLLKMIKSDAQLNQCIRMVGYINSESVCALRQQCDISLCLMGGFSLIEACAGGRPVIAYNVEWHNELINTRETGYLIEENDTFGVIKAIDFLLENPNEANLMGQRARQLVFNSHDIQVTTKIKQRHYAEILKND